MREITFEQAVHTLNTDSWLPGKTDSGQVETLEQGKVLYLPRLGFAISAKELLLLDVSNVKHGRKNISFNPVKNHLNGVANDNLSPVLTALFSRYYRACCQLMDDLIPEYSAHLHSPMNTLRLHSVNTWSNKSSWRKDDRRIHVDAFPSRPKGVSAFYGFLQILIHWEKVVNGSSVNPFISWPSGFYHSLQVILLSCVGCNTKSALPRVCALSMMI